MTKKEYKQLRKEARVAYQRWVRGGRKTVPWSDIKKELGIE